MANNSIERGLTAYTVWRNALTSSIVCLQRWLDRESLLNQGYKETLIEILNYVDDDNLYVSFVSEYSRGKTELINTLFFSQYGKRVLPSGLGRTTMCPTEIFYDINKPLGLSLLPIDKKISDTSLNHLETNAKSWVHFPISADKPNDAINAFKHLQDVIRVPLEVADRFGFSSAASNNNHSSSDNSLVEIPKWRHALVNIEHPLLKQKLVILDTPGLNAMGSETELTIKQLAKSHSIVFVLDNSAGVTKSDLELWSKHIKLENNASRIIALNKIDALWDSIKNTKEINNDIDRQVSHTAKQLSIAVDNVFPISAKVGLIGKIHQRANMIKQSRVLKFEKALAQHLVPSKKKIVLTTIFPLAQSIAKNIDEVLNQRSNALKLHDEQISSALNKNNATLDKVQHNLNQDKDRLITLSEQHSFIDLSFTSPIQALRKLLDTGIIEREKARCQSSFKLTSSMTKKRELALSYLRKMNQKMHLSVLRATEIKDLCDNINDNDHCKNNIHITFRQLDLSRHLSMLNNIEQSFLELKLSEGLSHKKQNNRLKKAFDNCSLATSRTFKRALNETNDWRHTLISPLETGLRNQSKRVNAHKTYIDQLSQSNKELKAKLKTNQMKQAIVTKQKTQLYALIHHINKHLLHSGYTEEDLYKPIEEPVNNVIKIKPNTFEV